MAAVHKIVGRTDQSDGLQSDEVIPKAWHRHGSGPRVFSICEDSDGGTLASKDKPGLWLTVRLSLPLRTANKATGAVERPSLFLDLLPTLHVATHAKTCPTQ